MDNIEWFKTAKFGMMIHFGLYSLLAGEYQGKKTNDYAEWIQSKFQISNQEYEKLTKAFNPIYFDAHEIVKIAKSCGMTYLVAVCKHHDGFALFHSKVDSYNVVDQTTFKRDIIQELSNACYEEGLKFGIYYSQDLDWHEMHGGGYQSNHLQSAGTTWDNSWDYKGKKNFDICFEKKILPQIKELMTNYGEISIAWFDVPMTLNQKQSQMIYDLVKKYQPHCLINSRLGNGQYDYVSLGDNEIPNQLIMQDHVDYNAVNGLKPSLNGLYETAGTMNHTWGYSSFDHDFKSKEEILTIKKQLNDLGINYLLNIGLDGLGRIPVESLQVFNEIHKMD